MPFRALLRCQALCVLALSTTACGNSDSPGEILNGSFGYRCITDSDPVCSPDDTFATGSLTAMPARVAVGASFGVAFRAESSAARDGSATIVPVSGQLLVETSDAGAVVFQARKQGAAGLLASRGSTVVDVVHLLLVDVDHVRIDAASSVVASTSSVDLAVGALQALSAAAADPSDEVLAGSLDAAWTSDDPAVVQIMTSPATDTITVRGGAPGETSVRASIGGREGAIVVKVVDQGAGSGGVAGGAP